MASGFPKQIANRNFLAPVGFKFTLAKEPKVDFSQTHVEYLRLVSELLFNQHILKILMFLETSYLMVIFLLDFLWMRI